MGVGKGVGVGVGMHRPFVGERERRGADEREGERDTVAVSKHTQSL